MSEIYKSIRENDDLDLALNYALTKIRTAIKGRDDDLHILNLVTIDKKKYSKYQKYSYSGLF